MTTGSPAVVAPAAAKPATTPERTPALELIDLALQAAEAYRRPDVGTRLRWTRERVADPDVRVLVVGEFKQGKSALINALVNAEVCPVDDDLATSVTTVVRYGAGEPSVTVVHAPSPGGPGGHSSHSGHREERTSVALTDIARYVTEAGNRGNHRRVSHVEVTLQRRILSGGLVLVDTPGVGGLGSAHGAMTMAALPSADAVLLVSDAGTEYTAPEMRFLERARTLCPLVTCVLSKTDLYPYWRHVAELDRSHLGRAGVAGDLLPISSRMRAEASRTNDQELNTESGFAALTTFLRERVVKQSAVHDRRTAGREVGAAVEMMVRPMRAELEVLEDPAHGRQLLATLTAARDRAEGLKKQSARWQTTLNDGVADLQADIDHDLRDRLRTRCRDAEAQLDEADPAGIWDELADQLDEEIVEEVTTNFVWAGERADHLARRVGEHFAAEGARALPDMRHLNPTDGFVDRIEPILRPDLSRHKFGQKLFTGLRGGYGGMLMAGMATSLAGLGLINPISAVAGLVFGGYGLAEERRQLLLRRRGDAKSAVRKHVDDVTFSLGKDSRDLLRSVQRTLRDHFQEAASELTASTTAAVTAAQQAVTAATTERTQRVSDLKAEVARLDAVAGSARELLAAEKA